MQYSVGETDGEWDGMQVRGKTISKTNVYKHTKTTPQQHTDTHNKTHAK